MKTLHRQQGMSFLLIVALLALLAFAAMFAVKVGPAYIEFRTISKLVDETNMNAHVMKQPRSKVLSHIDQAFRTNNLWDYRADDTVSFQKSKGGLLVKVDYEKRTNLFANIDVVSVFKANQAKP